MHELHHEREITASQRICADLEAEASDVLGGATCDYNKGIVRIRWTRQPIAERGSKSQYCSLSGSDETAAFIRGTILLNDGRPRRLVHPEQAIVPQQRFPSPSCTGSEKTLLHALAHRPSAARLAIPYLRHFKLSAAKMGTKRDRRLSTALASK